MHGVGADGDVMARFRSRRAVQAARTRAGRAGLRGERRGVGPAGVARPPDLAERPAADKARCLGRALAGAAAGARGHAEGEAEGPAEMALIAEAPAIGDLGNAAAVVPGRGKVEPCPVQAPVAQIVGKGRALQLEQLLQVALRHGFALRDVAHRQVGFRQARLDRRRHALKMRGLHLGDAGMLGADHRRQRRGDELGNGYFRRHQVGAAQIVEIDRQRAHHALRGGRRDGGSQDQWQQQSAAAEALHQPLARHLQGEQLEIVVEMHRPGHAAVAERNVAFLEPRAAGKPTRAEMVEHDEQHVRARRAPAAGILGEGRRGGAQAHQGSAARREQDVDRAGAIPCHGLAAQ